MIEVMTDELDRTDEAFSGNRLLSTFATDARVLVEPYGDVIDLDGGETVLRRGEDVDPEKERVTVSLF